jgi:hypothetical protein
MARAMTEIDTGRLDVLVERYFGEAQACRQMADATMRPTDNVAWLVVAAGWIRLAEEAKTRPRLH